MSQKTSIRELDSLAFADFLADGLADSGTYTSPDGGGVEITYLLDHQQPIEAEFGGRTFGRQREITLQLAQVTPEEGGIIDGDDGTRWVLQSPIEEDESTARWVVCPKRSDGA